jgi:hypothetical protein
MGPTKTRKLPHRISRSVKNWSLRNIQGREALQKIGGTSEGANEDAHLIQQLFLLVFS